MLNDEEVKLMVSQNAIPSITVKEFGASHDRFLIIDEIDIYHIGASLKDLGKKWFAFSKMNISALDFLSNIGKDRLSEKNKGKPQS